MNPPLDETALFAYEHHLGASLPKRHADELRRRNGSEVYGGYYKLFGLGTTLAIDLGRWNVFEGWKFAWPEARTLRDYLCFAETAWGDQFAYRLDDLKQEPDHASVYRLDALTMKAEKFEKDFTHFLENEFRRVAKSPYDSMTIATRARLGDLGPREHVALMPPLLLGGPEDPANAVKLPALVAMVANGDLASQLTPENDHREVAELETYIDDQGRPRLKVRWRDE